MQCGLIYINYRTYTKRPLFAATELSLRPTFTCAHESEIHPYTLMNLRYPYRNYLPLFPTLFPSPFPILFLSFFRSPLPSLFHSLSFSHTFHRSFPHFPPLFPSLFPWHLSGNLYKLSNLHTPINLEFVLLHVLINPGFAFFGPPTIKR